MGETGHRFIAENNLEGLCTTTASLCHSTLSTPSFGAIKKLGVGKQDILVDFTEHLW
jgi:hypothetical protein